MHEVGGKAFCFEGYTLDLRRGRLRREDRDVELRPKSFEVLRYLVENAGRLVSKDELIRAVWTNVVVTDESLTRCVSDVRLALQDHGQRIIKTVPRRGYLLAAPVSQPAVDARLVQSATATSLVATSALQLPDKPSIAVLPFEYLSNDREEEYFADGMVEDITMALSRIRWLFVIARNSSFTYKARAVDVRQVGRELGVRYVLEGSVRKAGLRVRISGQLVDASTGAHIWADRFDGELAEIFDLQDQVTTSVVGAIAVKLEQAEIARAKRKPIGSLDAYDYYLRGRASADLVTREATDDALRLFYRAIDLDPDLALAHGRAAACYIWRSSNGWMTDRVQETAEAVRLARRAVELDNEEALALGWAGMTLTFLDTDFDYGASLLERALALNPNLMQAWFGIGWVRIWDGEAEAAIEAFARAMRLSPLDPFGFTMQHGMAFAHFLASRYDEASSWAEKALRAYQNSQGLLGVMAATNALAGRLEEARKAITRLRELDPAQSVSSLKIRLRRPEDFARYGEGLRKAGLPE
jgi:TolB-like protein/Tfp pilus assembly protein PilF